MQLIAHHPLTEAVVHPHCGRPVAAMLANGDVVCGVLHKVENGHIYMTPIHHMPTAAVAQIKNQVSAQMKMTKLPAPSVRHSGQAKINAWGFGPWGWGWGWIFPLFFLTALFTFPFFW